MGYGPAKAQEIPFFLDLPAEFPGDFTEPGDFLAGIHELLQHRLDIRRGQRRQGADGKLDNIG